MGEERIEANRESDGCEGARPTAPHRIGNRYAHGRSLAEFMPLEIRDELFEILNRDSTGGAASWKAGQIGSVQSKLHHPRLHPRRHIARAGGVGRHRQTADGRLHLSLAARFSGEFRSVGRLFGFAILLRGRGIEAKTRRILCGSFHVTKDRPARAALGYVEATAEDASRLGLDTT